MALSTDPPPTETCPVAYKEWAGICRAVAEGRQTVLLRKGGIAESGGSFRPEHPAFWLYPTRFHQPQQGLRSGFADPGPAPEPGTVPLEILVVVQSILWLDRLEDCLTIGEFHVWTDDTVRQRFAYRHPGLWLMTIRAYRRPRPWPLIETAEAAGCKTWVPLDPAPDPASLEPVLADEAAALRERALADLLPALARGEG